MPPVLAITGPLFALIAFAIDPALAAPPIAGIAAIRMPARVTSQPVAMSTKRGPVIARTAVIAERGPCSGGSCQ